MAEDARIIGLTQWLQSPAGRYLLEWEQQHLDTAVADLFGFHALQVGLPELDALRANRMPHRWVAEQPGPPESAGTLPRAAVALRVNYDALPFDSASLDLVVLPHTLELAQDPHQTLREVERVLVPEGRVVIVGFNPASLWGLRQRCGRLRKGLGIARRRGLYLPDAGEFLGYRRLRDWLRLLSFEVEAGRFGCYRPPVVSERWLTRTAWMDQSGERWWPVFGAAYFVTAVKRVRGMRLVGLVRDQSLRAKPSAVIATQKTHRQRQHEEEPA
ncbi:MAG: methyltransferase domain-containing protein [Piscinibacter sp.]|nr:methyltransferase domain-containing protein [Piscinibacter sp.]